MVFSLSLSLFDGLSLSCCCLFTPFTSLSRSSFVGFEFFSLDNLLCLGSLFRRVPSVPCINRRVCFVPSIFQAGELVRKETRMKKGKEGMPLATLVVPLPPTRSADHLTLIHSVIPSTLLCSGAFYTSQIAPERRENAGKKSCVAVLPMPIRDKRAAARRERIREKEGRKRHGASRRTESTPTVFTILPYRSHFLAHHRVPSSASPAPQHVDKVAQFRFLTLVNLLHRLRATVVSVQR